MMAEVIHEGKTEVQEVYRRPPNTYTCDQCEKDLGRDKGVIVGFFGTQEMEHGEADIGDEVNFCSFDCMFKFFKTSSKRLSTFKRIYGHCDTDPGLYISNVRLRHLEN